MKKMRNKRIGGRVLAAGTTAILLLTAWVFPALATESETEETAFILPIADADDADGNTLKEMAAVVIKHTNEEDALVYTSTDLYDSDASYYAVYTMYDDDTWYGYYLDYSSDCEEIGVVQWVAEGAYDDDAALYAAASYQGEVVTAYYYDSSWDLKSTSVTIEGLSVDSDDDYVLEVDSLPDAYVYPILLLDSDGYCVGIAGTSDPDKVYATYVDEEYFTSASSSSGSSGDSGDSGTSGDSDDSGSSGSSGSSSSSSSVLPIFLVVVIVVIVVLVILVLKKKKGGSSPNGNGTAAGGNGQDGSGANSGEPGGSSGSDPWANNAGSGGSDPWASGGQTGGSDPWANGGQAGGSDPWANGGQTGGSDPWSSGGQTGGSDPWSSGGQTGGSDPWANGGQTGTSASSMNGRTVGGMDIRFEETQPNEDISGNFCVVCVGGVLKGSIYPIGDYEITFGRDASCTVCFPADTKGVSRMHCKLLWQNGTLMLMDCGSSYGTYAAQGRLQPNVPMPITEGESFYLAEEQNCFCIQMV